MVKKITFNNGTEEKTLIVQNCFAYTYNAMKTVLKLDIAEADHSYDEITELKKCEGKISYYEDDVLKSEYEGFNLGSKGFIVNCAEGNFNVEMAQESSYSIRLDRIEATLDFVLEFLGGVGEDEEEE